MEERLYVNIQYEIQVNTSIVQKLGLYLGGVLFFKLQRLQTPLCLHSGLHNLLKEKREFTCKICVLCALLLKK